MNSHKRTLLIAAVVLVLALGAGIVSFLVGRSPLGVPSEFAFSFPGDKEYEYNVEFSAETETSREQVSPGDTAAPGRVVEGRGALGLVGTLFVHGRGRDVKSGGWYVEYRVAAVSGVEFVVQGMSIPINDQAKTEIEAGRAIALMTPTGRIRSLHFGAETLLFVRQILRPLVMELQTIIKRDIPAWESTQDGFNGRARVAWEVVRSVRPDEIALVGSTRSYNPLRTVEVALRDVPPVIKSELGAQLHSGGYLKKLKGNEAVTVTDEGTVARSAVKVSVELRGVNDVKPNPLGAEALGALDVLASDEIPGEGEAIEAMRRNRVAGYTFELLRSDLRAYGAAGEMPNHRQWFHRTVGLLLLKPETAAELAKAWFEPGLSDGAHNLIVDVLANAGHGEAQAALREILGNREAHSDPNFHRLVQSMTLLREPEVESVEFLQSLSTTVQQPPGRVAAVISLGAGIGKLHARGEVDAANRINQSLRGLSENAATPGDVQGVLYAIGNTGMESNLGLLGRYLTSPDDNTRATSARALRKFTGDDARSRLRSLTTDPSPLVQREAVRALRNNGISREDLAILMEGVRSGRIQTPTLPGLIRALSTSLQPGVDSAGILAVLRARAGEDREILRQINELAIELAK